MAMAVASNCTTRQRLPQVEFPEVAYFMEKLMYKIHDFFDDQTLIDVTFKVSNPEDLIPAHRLVLSASSTYFMDLFNSEKGVTPVVEISDIDSDTFERLIAYCYTGKALITVENVDKLLKAAIYLKLDEAVSQCVDFIMENITVYTLRRVYDLERETECSLLQNKIAEYEKKHFMEVCQSIEFLDFEYEKLYKIVESNNLNVSCEEDVFGAVKRWYQHDTLTRQQHIPNLINCLRLTQFDIDFILTHIQSLPGCELLAYKALSWIGLPATRQKLTISYTKPRKGLSENWDDIQLLAVVSTTSQDNSRGPGNVFQYNKTADEWHKYADINIDTVCFGVILYDQSLVFVGGFKNKKPVNFTNWWNVRVKAWDRGPSMLQPRYDLSVIVLDEKIYAIGGARSDDHFLQSAEMYAIPGQWKSIADMNTARCRAGVVSLNGKIYVMGGYNGVDLNSVECFDPTTACWTACANMNDAHDAPGAAVHKDEIYVLGGWCENFNTSVERYNPKANIWTKICSLPYGRWGTGCVSIRNQLWAVGGYDNDEKNGVTVYDKEYNEWFEKKPLPISGVHSCYIATATNLLQNE
ncbi:kelch-like protein 5 [Eurosta solidaginis]|uniref:kelch-like protein 5 n=1 Tax=Eurosta solidaginis TaxID=178769 RepID=UPI003530B54E